MNLYEVVQDTDGTLSIIILWHPSLKNDPASLWLDTEGTGGQDPHWKITNDPRHVIPNNVAF